MAGMLFVLFAVAALLTSRCSCAGPSYPELNPVLGKYQNPSQCMPIQETWYAVYRNYENDPAFGGTAKCGKFSSLGPEENGVYTMLVQFTETSITVVTNLTSYEGYDVDNLQYFHAVGQDDSVLLYIAYVGCQDCVVFRNSYISACSYQLLPPSTGDTDQSREDNYLHKCPYTIETIIGCPLANLYTTDDACTLVVPESALGKHSCCDFIFDLLCGTAPKYYTYDESCAN